VVAKGEENVSLLKNECTIHVVAGNPDAVSVQCDESEVRWPVMVGRVKQSDECRYTCLYLQKNQPTQNVLVLNCKQDLDILVASMKGINYTVGTASGTDNRSTVS